MNIISHEKKKCYVEVVRFFRTLNQDLLLASLSVTTESAATSEVPRGKCVCYRRLDLMGFNVFHLIVSVAKRCHSVYTMNIHQ